MIESPVLDELIEIVRQRERTKVEADTRLTVLRGAIVSNLEARFGSAPANVPADLAGVSDTAELDGLLRVAATCPDLAAFAFELQRVRGNDTR